MPQYLYRFQSGIRDSVGLPVCQYSMGTKVLHFLEGRIPCAVRAIETDPRIAARKVATFGAAKSPEASAVQAGRCFHILGMRG